MNLFKKIYRFFIKEKYYVLLINHEGKFYKRKVEWLAGLPYAAPYLPDTRCLLLPQGKIKGVIFIMGWLPASNNMLTYYTATMKIS